MLKNISKTVRQIKKHCDISERSHTSGYVCQNHWHDYFEFEIVTAGEYEHICNGHIYTAKPGDGWLMSYFDHHSLRAITDSKILNISFSSGFLPEDITDYIVSENNVLCTFDDKSTEIIKNRCFEVIGELSGDELFSSHLTEVLLEEIIIKAIRQSRKNNTKNEPALPALIQSVTSYLHKHYKDDVAISAVAEKFGVSAGHLGVLFKKTFSTSYNDYVNRMRMKYACSLLLSSELPAKDIAFESGYNSVEYFFSVFKRYFGCTPMEYRRNF